MPMKENQQTSTGSTSPYINLLNQQVVDQQPVPQVCSAEGEDFGIGKTAILDSVHRSFTLLVPGPADGHLGVLCSTDSMSLLFMFNSGKPISLMFCSC